MKSLTFNIPPNPVEAHKLLAGAIWKQVKAHAVAGNRIAVRICDQSKSRDQEEKYHALIGEISDQVGDVLADREEAKRLLVSAFRIDTINMPEFKELWAKFGEAARMKQGFRGETVVLGLQTRNFPVKLASAFIEWLYAFGSEYGVTFTERFIDPETGEIVTTKRTPKRKEAA